MSNADNVRLVGMIGADEGKAKSLGKTMTIVLLPTGFDKDAERELNLSQSERAALSLMQKVSKRVGSPVFDLDGMKRHCEDWKNGYKALNLFTEACSSEFAMLGARATAARWPAGWAASAPRWRWSPASSRCSAAISHWR